MILIFSCIALISSIIIYFLVFSNQSNANISIDTDDIVDNRTAAFLRVAAANLRPARAQADLALTFANRTPIDFDVFGVTEDWATIFLSRQRAVLVLNSSAARWPALRSWADTSFWQQSYKEQGISEWAVHVPTSSHVRMHASHRDHKLLNRPGVDFSASQWHEAPLRIADVMSAQFCTYLLLNMHHVPAPVSADVDIRQFFAPWAPPHQINAWITAPSVTTPLHYDLMDNFYVQVAGRKRFVLLPPEEHFAVHIHPAVHPSWRQSYLDLDNDTFMAQHAELRDRLRAQALEVVLEPGQVLFIPALWLHHVTTVGDQMSISVSIHSDTRVANLREQMMLAADRGVAAYVTPRRARLQASAALASAAYVEFVGAMLGASSDLPRRCAESRWNEAMWSDDDRFSVGLYEQRIEAERLLRESTAVSLDAPTKAAMRALGELVRAESEGVAEKNVMSQVALDSIECDLLELMCAEILADTLHCASSMSRVRDFGSKTGGGGVATQQHEDIV
jgi:hypothetical protein